MNNLLKTSLWGSAFLLFFVFSGCGEDEATPENFNSLEEAQTALSGSEAEIFLALYELANVEAVASTFDGSYPSGFTPFKSSRTKRLNKNHSPHSFGYNAQTGYWSFDTTITDPFNLTVNLRIKFTPRDVLTGLPNESTNLMEYNIAETLSETAEEGFLALGYDADFNAAGIAAYRAGTGNLTINGSNKVNFSLDITLDTDHVVVDYNHSYNVHDVVLDPEATYPQSGSFDFTIKADVSPSSYGEGFYVAGTITFDGTNIAVLEFGGYTFHLDLDTEIITPVV